MTLTHVDIVFQIIVFLFAISVHESAHAWTAYRCGDPTAFMLGRVTLNPIKHIDLFGTVIMPILAMLTHLPLIGWAKPTPVNTRNLKRFVRDDIFVSLAGIAVNLIVAGLAVVGLVILIVAIPGGKAGVAEAINFRFTGELAHFSQSSIVPLGLLLYEMMTINVLLACFNIIPVPPLDGSHVLRHMLPNSIREVYDNVGRFGLLILMFWGGRILGPLINPVLSFFDSILFKFYQ
jgi:Zn-dependent protease